MSCDGGSEWISAEDLANIFAVQSWVDVDGPDEFQSVLGSDEFGHALAHRS